MAEILKKWNRLEEAVKAMGVTGYPVFGLDMERDEVLANKSFIIYNDDGDLRPAGQGLQYLKDFTVMFVTREEAVIDEIRLIESLKGTGLVFDGSTTEQGSLLGTDDVVMSKTFTFHSVIRMCD